MPTFLNLQDLRFGDRTKDVIAAGAILFAATYDLILDRFGVRAASTIIDNLAIAALGALSLWFYLSETDRNRNVARARERILLAAELNYQVRDAVALIARSAILEDRRERLRQVDEAVDRIDGLLADIVPLRGAATDAQNLSARN